MLAGGSARRLGGADKPGVRVGGRALLDRVLAACAGARTTVVVADPRPTARPVTWAREEPPGGGPLAALDAGLRHTTAEHVLVLSADLPFLDERTVGRLLTALRASGTDGALLADADGRDQPLVAAYRAPALRRTLATLTDTASAGGSVRTGTAPVGSTPHTGTEPADDTAPTGSAPTHQAPRSGAATGSLAGLPLRRLTTALDLTRVPGPVASFDCDTWDDIATARARIREHGHVLDEWISAAKDELGIDIDVDTAVLLDLARDAAHGVARPAAPLTTFLVGYAAARAGGGPEAVAEAARKAAALAQRWAEEAASEAADSQSADTGPPAGLPGVRPDVAPDATPDTRPDTRPDVP
ncbi:NTP transferase domain-containing protein [Streptomyces sp. TRM68367]|uniref:NTP transferase domain-containing protein n=1 Tax=Streptomyces sp. TRM68367 TaxID=2758415 RepID=UPI00165A41A3|nr:molybdenum cofactor guanylyltransferase [Streptomyces sp. TRM68367]MBC9727711.1 molybdenum cofactor guanylyltransferase [Streptomyces sp. TRM68367]